MSFPAIVHRIDGGEPMHLNQTDLLRMCATRTVIATGSYRRIRRLQVVIPPKRRMPKEVRVRFWNRMKYPITSQAGRTVVEEFLPEAAAHVWKHHAQRCGEWPHKETP